MPFFCITKYVNLLYNAIQASQVDEKANSIVHKQMYLTKICTRKQNEAKYHCQSLHMANTLQEKGRVTKRKGEQ
jgi:hypothetical protein